MGVSSTTNRVSFVGDGSSTTFSFPYYFFTQQDLNVYLFDTGSSIVYPQTLGINYSITGMVNSQGVYPSGGNVVTTSAFPSYLQLIITRAPAPLQNYALLQNASINSLALTQQMDYMTLLVQRLQDQMARCVQLPDGLGYLQGSSFGTVLPQNLDLPSQAAYAPIVVNSGATGLTLGFTVGSAGFSGTLPVTNGGTGQNQPLTPYAVWYSQNASQMGNVIGGAPGQVLTYNASSAPSWGNVSVTGSSVSAIVAGAGITTAGSTIVTVSASSIVLPSVVSGLGINITGTSVYTINASSIVLPSMIAGPGITITGTSVATVSASSIVLPTIIAGVGINISGTSVATINASSIVLPSLVAGGGVTITGTTAYTVSAAGAVQTIVNATSAIQITSPNNTLVLVGSGCPSVNIAGSIGSVINLKLVNPGAITSPCVITGSGSQLIDSLSSITLNTNKEQYSLGFDGTNWDIYNHFTSLSWTGYSSVLSVSWGTTGSSSFSYSRLRDCIKITGQWINGTIVTTSPGWVSLPPGLTINSSVINILNSGSTSGQVLGIYGVNNANGGPLVSATISSNSSLWFGGGFGGGAMAIPAETGNITSGGSRIVFNSEWIPIAGWIP